MTPYWSWTLNSQKYSIYANTYQWGPNVGPFHSTNSLFSRYNMYKVSENRKCTEWPKTELEHLTVKSTQYTLDTTPWGLNFGPFRPKTSRFRDTTCQQYSQKHPVYTKDLLLGPKFWSVSLYDKRFSRYRTFYNSPLTTMLNGHKKGQTKFPKCQYSNFTILLTTLVPFPGKILHSERRVRKLLSGKWKGRDPLQEYAWGANLVCSFFQSCRLKL